MPEAAKFYVSDLVRNDENGYAMTRHESAEKAIEFIEKRLVEAPNGSKLYLLQTVATFTVEAKINREDMEDTNG